MRFNIPLYLGGFVEKLFPIINFDILDQTFDWEGQTLIEFDFE